ncbi:hypothetical protein ACQ4LE_007301 [Meloidogyne hapla]|uniref:BZIP domain-containing protein n=1 Tax=Meloidogyne hapla TaxID=6305 RepID=A0A1I8BZG6_MELHA
MASSLTHSLAAAAHHRHGHTSPDSFSASTIHFHALDLSKSCNNNINTSCTITNTKDSFPSLIVPQLSSTTPINSLIPPTPSFINSSVLVIPQQQKQQIYQNLFSSTTNNSSIFTEKLKNNKNIFGNSVEEQMKAVANVLLGNGSFQLQNIVKCPTLLSEFNNLINTRELPSINSLGFLQSAETYLPQMSMASDSSISSNSSGPDSDGQTSSNSPISAITANNNSSKVLTKLTNDKKEENKNLTKIKKKQEIIKEQFQQPKNLVKKQLVRDDAYWERRRKNNYAAKRSRDTRRRKEDEIAVRAVILEQENLRLRFELERLRTEIERYRIVAFSQGIVIQKQQNPNLISENLKNSEFISGQNKQQNTLNNGQKDSNEIIF